MLTKDNQDGINLQNTCTLLQPNGQGGLKFKGIANGFPLKVTIYGYWFD